jgi:hypothetical protein
MQVLPQVAMLAGTMAVACGAVLVLRRLTGAIEPPRGPEAALAACGAGLLLVVIGDLAVRPTAARAVGQTMAWLPAMLTRLGLLMAVAAVGLPLRFGSAGDALATGLALILSLMVAFRGPAGGLWAARLLRRPTPVARAAIDDGLPAAVSQATLPTVAAAFSPAQASDQAPPHDRLQDADPQAAPAGSLLQRFERFALPNGAECVRGRLSVMVPEGARTGYAHVGFCPPLAMSPVVDVTTDYDGVEAVVSAAEVLPWGVRIECRLDEPAEETIDIPVDILATTPT